MAKDLCPFCGLPKYEYGVRNCCAEGEAEEYGNSLKKHQRRRYKNLMENIEKIMVNGQGESPLQLSLFVEVSPDTNGNN